MTSSLVGSEMCIRDRFSQQPRGPVAIRCAALVCHPRFDREHGPPRPSCTCLLYTSDAADDM
eukprot:6384805-Prorocentrum_lima.AAC.1